MNSINNINLVIMEYFMYSFDPGKGSELKFNATVMYSCSKQGQKNDQFINSIHYLLCSIAFI